MKNQMCSFLVSIFVVLLVQNTAFAQTSPDVLIKEFPVPPGSHPHDVAPAKNGSVWYTAQRLGELGMLDPISGRTQHIALGEGSAPHGVIVGPDEAAWITDGGLNAIVRVDPITRTLHCFHCQKIPDMQISILPPLITKVFYGLLVKAGFMETGSKY